MLIGGRGCIDILDNDFIVTNLFDMMMMPLVRAVVETMIMTIAMVRFVGSFSFELLLV